MASSSPHIAATVRPTACTRYLLLGPPPSPRLLRGSLPTSVHPWLKLMRKGILGELRDAQEDYGLGGRLGDVISHAAVPSGWPVCVRSDHAHSFCLGFARTRAEGRWSGILVGMTARANGWAHSGCPSGKPFIPGLEDVCGRRGQRGHGPTWGEVFPAMAVGPPAQPFLLSLAFWNPQVGWLWNAPWR